MLTPTAKDNLTAPSMAKWAGARELIRVLSEAAARTNLPTPVTASNTGGQRWEGGSGARKKLKALGLYDLKRLAASPVARNRSGKASEETLSRNSRPLNEQLYALGITEATALLAIYLWLMAWPTGYADTAYQNAPSKASSRAGARRSETLS
jgi:hypothetical protein